MKKFILFIILLALFVIFVPWLQPKVNAAPDHSAVFVVDHNTYLADGQSKDMDVARLFTWLPTSISAAARSGIWRSRNRLTKGMLTYKDFGGKVNFRSEKITGLVFDFANQKAVFKGTAKSPAGAIQASVFKVEVEDHNGAGNDLFKIWLYDKNDTEIYHAEGPLKLGSIRILAQR